MYRVQVRGKVQHKNESQRILSLHGGSMRSLGQVGSLTSTYMEGPQEKNEDIFPGSCSSYPKHGGKQTEGFGSFPSGPCDASNHDKTAVAGADTIVAATPQVLEQRCTSMHQLCFTSKQ